MGYTTTRQQWQRKPTPEEKTCYNCYKLGHWHENCPKGRISSSSDQQLIFRSRMRFLGFDELSEFQAVILCDCGESRRPLISRSQKNPGRQYYSECSCGRSRFRWADVVEPEEKIWVPKCKCKAGFCRVCVQRNGPDTGRYFFKCCIREGQGQCEFRQLVDDTVLQTPMIYDEDETLNNCSTTDVGTGNDNKAVMDTAGVPPLRTPPQNLRSASPPPPPSSSASGPSKRRKRLVFDNELFEEEEEDAGSAVNKHKKNGKRPCYGDNSFPGSSNPDSVMRETVSQCFTETAKNLQNKLVSVLESMDFHNHEAMAEEARTTFDALNSLPFSLNNNIIIRPSFRLRVEDFIECASSLSRTERSISNGEKEKLEEDSLNQSLIMAELEASKQRIQMMDKSAATVREELFMIEAELCCRKVENEKLESKYEEISKSETVFKQERVAAFNKAKFLLRASNIHLVEECIHL